MPRINPLAGNYDGGTTPRLVGEWAKAAVLRPPRTMDAAAIAS